MEILPEYVDKHGKIYGVPTYRFEDFNDWRKYPKIFVAYNPFEKIPSWGASDEGIYIEKFDNNSKAFRVHSEIQDFNFKYFSGRYTEQILVEQLLKKQPDIKLTQFPLGIVSVENTIIGQVIPFYDNYETLKQSIEYLKPEELYKLYLHIIEILTELYNNGIIYTDIHGGNIMVNPENHDVKLIDFESQRVFFEEYSFKCMIDNLKALLNELNEKLGLNPIPGLTTTKNLEDIGYVISDDLVRIRRA